jgi:NitT/TauT family transport system substrate-binding protein
MRGVIGLACAMLVAAAVSARAETLTVAVGQKGIWNTNFLELAEQQGFFKDAGLDVDITYTQGGATTLQPVIAGKIDLACATGLLGAISAYVKGAPIRIISAEATGNPAIFWYAKPERHIHTIKDAAGKTIGYSSPGSSGNLMLLALLDQDHVAARPVSTGDQASTLTQVMTDQIDVGWALAPLLLSEINAGKLIMIARGTDVVAMRDETGSAHVVSLDALQHKRAALTRFLKVYERITNWAYKDPRAVDYLAQTMHVTRAAAQTAVDQFFPRSMFRIGDPIGLQHVLDEAYATKRIPEPMKPEQIKGLFDILYRVPDSAR